jgi:aromatic ring-opening dioxygenase LigB subunit
MGDLNSRNGQDQRAGHSSMGRYGRERIRNTNEERLIDFCIDNGLLIGNTFYNHKQIHKITFEGEGRDVKSITDYILYPVELTYVLKDVKVIRGAELSTDHRLLVTDTRFRKGLPEKTKKYQKLFTEKLKREGTQEEYQKNLDNKLESMTKEEGYENWNLDDRWTKLKSVKMEVAEQTCGKKWVNTKRKKET